MEDYKQDIINSRVGAFGASEADLISRIAFIGKVPQQCYERMAVCKGLTPYQPFPANRAMRYGDEMELAVYEHLRKDNRQWESNKKIVSERFSMPNVKLLAHIDFFLADYKKKTLFLGECKTTKDDIATTEKRYRNQLYVEYTLGREYATNNLGKDWRVKLMLCHYSTNGLNLDDPDCDLSFNTDRLSVKQVRFTTPPFDIQRGMSVINDYLASLTEYYPAEIIDGNLLPERVRETFESYRALAIKIDEMNAKMDEFKTYLYDFLVSKDIKSIKNDTLTITRVDDSESVSFDHKRFLAEYQAKHPTKYKRLMREYEKRTVRKGYAKITLRKENKE